MGSVLSLFRHRGRRRVSPLAVALFAATTPLVLIFAVAFHATPTKAYTCPCKIWPDTATPGTPAFNDNGPVELGVKFKADVDGQITGVRFYKGTGNGGTHIGNVWSTSGTNLGTVTFTGETGSGWQQANFATPVNVTAGTTYVASYFAPQGHYAVDVNFFSSAGVDNAPLHALSNADGGGNGVFNYSSVTSFPNSSSNASNYWVDVVFQPSPPPQPPPPPPSTPGNPILVVTAQSNPFTQYYSEILKAEGLNDFVTGDISTITSTILSNYDVVVLGDMTLTPAQVTMFTTWVNGGGNLIAMSPDSQLASLLGLTSTGTTRSDAYMLTNTSTSPGLGIVNQTMQYHGSADLYTLNGATAVATIYSDANTATANPAVTMKTVGTGKAAAFTYDLAKSIVYTRQGNPAWAGQERDGQTPIRPDDLFFPNWVDLTKVAIPQADEQQRLLANMITQFDLNHKPVPRFWYLPSGAKAAVIYAMDDHNNNGPATTSLFDKLIANSTTGCSVTNWACLRATSWLYVGTPLTSTQANTYNGQGFEMGVHVQNNCTNFVSGADLGATYTSQMQQFQSTYPGLPTQTTHRYHCIVWSDWDTQALTEKNNGIRFDANYYYWPKEWMEERPGMFTGSGIPMRFANTDGSTVDVYQAPSQLVNESEIPYATNVGTLLDNALGSQGFYGMFTTHDDWRDTTFSDAVIAAVKSHNVPMITAKQALAWLDGRNNSSYTNVLWNSNQLTFTLTQASGATNLQGMLPLNAATKSLTTLKRGTTTVAFTTQTIKGIKYAFFPATSGNYTATYNSTLVSNPTSSPTISSLWTSSMVPANPSSGDAQATEVGVRFSANESGQITGIRFYKDATNTGTHVGHLWTESGTSLATVTFTNETTSGWQQANLSSPVNITAGTKYIVSYYAPNGNYSSEGNYFPRTYGNTPLQAPASTQTSPNGLYIYGSDSFPTQTFNATNYWVDVVFSH